MYPLTYNLITAYRQQVCQISLKSRHFLWHHTFPDSSGFLFLGQICVYSQQFIHNAVGNQPHFLSPLFEHTPEPYAQFLSCPFIIILCYDIVIFPFSVGCIHLFHLASLFYLLFILVFLFSQSVAKLLFSTSLLNRSIFSSISDLLYFHYSIDIFLFRTQKTDGEIFRLSIFLLIIFIKYGLISFPD